jgi:hypothetical protein
MSYGPYRLAERLFHFLPLLLATCSSTSSGSDVDGGLSLPPSDSGLVGCVGTPVAPGCYTNGNASYKVPATSASCSPPGGPASGSADHHCAGRAPQPVKASSCNQSPPLGEAGSSEAGASDSGPPPGMCGENGPDYGATMYGTEGDDDDCKYHVSYETTPVCRNDGTYLIVQASYLTRGGAPLTGACAFAELCLNDTHAAPNVDQRPPGQQLVVEGPPGTYTIGPVLFDEGGDWTVRFHFNEQCCDVLADSPHGHAAFHVRVP